MEESQQTVFALMKAINNNPGEAMQIETDAERGEKFCEYLREAYANLQLTPMIMTNENGGVIFYGRPIEENA